MKQVPAHPDRPSEPLAGLLAALERQDALVADLDRLSASQATMIRPGRGAELLAIVESRQRVIDALLSGQERVNALIAAIPPRAGAIGEAERARIESILERVQGRLTAVIERDAHDAGALAAARDAAAQDGVSLGAAQQARRAYVGSAAPASRFADREG
jgi:hypothetical protein